MRLLPSRSKGAPPSGASHVGVCVLKLRAHEQGPSQGRKKYAVLHRACEKVEDLSLWIGYVLGKWATNVYPRRGRSSSSSQAEEIWIHWRYKGSKKEVFNQLNFHLRVINDNEEGWHNFEHTVWTRYNQPAREPACIIRSNNKFPFGILYIAVEGLDS